VSQFEQSLVSSGLKNRSIVITGAFGSLGAVVAESARAAGAKVAAVDLSDLRSAPTFGSGITPFGSVDLVSPVSAEAVFSMIASGSIDTWDAMYAVNLRTAFSATRGALPFLLEQAAKHGGGRIINIGAAGAMRAGLGMGAYAASKAGVAKLTEALAEELKDSGITANAIQPSIIDTAVNRADMPGADFSRWVKPQQIADLIVFLLSDLASAITGAVIPVVGRV
jgi:NAD(P)-dependent dehydrogenase (short-subunit alcohol dehydrogenase family)